MSNFENARWRTAAIMKMVISLYLRGELSDFDDIWCAGAQFHSSNSHVNNFTILGLIRISVVGEATPRTSYIYWLVSSALPWNQKFARSERDHDGTKYTKVNKYVYVKSVNVLHK